MSQIKPMPQFTTRVDQQTTAEHPERNFSSVVNTGITRRILVADANGPSRSALVEILSSWGYESIQACEGEQVWALLQQDEAPRLVILDWILSGLNGTDLCREIRTKCVDKYTYVLMVTSHGEPADVVRGLEAGADDYLIKPYNPLELRARLAAGRRVLEHQERLLGVRDTLRRQATTDALTGVANRSSILETLERELVRSRREVRPLGLVMVDIDHFKNINDLFGHMAGDKVLRRVAHRLKAAIRPYDAIGRFGGEEFLLVLPGCDAANSVKLANRIRESIAAETITHLGQPLSISASFGVVSYRPQQPSPLQDLLHGADVAMYRAKKTGRNRVVVGDPIKVDEAYVI